MRGNRVVYVAVALAALLAADASPAVPRGSTPTLGRTVEVQRLSGTVLVEVPRSSVPEAVSGRRVVPVGSTVDVTAGKADLTAAGLPGAGPASGTFDGGAFVVGQGPSGMVELSLTGGRSRSTACGPAHARRAIPAAVPPAVLRTLHAHVHGHFRVSGHDAAATVRGTELTVAENCQGTSIHSLAGAVDTTSADGQLTALLIPGETDLYRCASSSSGRFCLELDGFNSRAAGSYFQPGISTARHEHSYDVCITPPSGRVTCTTWLITQPFFIRGHRDVRGGFDVLFCDAAHKGAYSVTWRLHGVTLGAPLTFNSMFPGSDPNPCTGFFGNGDDHGVAAPLPANVKLANRFVVPAPFALDSLLVYLAPTGAAGSEKVEGVLYGDAGGRPGALLAVSSPFTFHSGMKAGTQVLSFPAQPHQRCVAPFQSYCRHFGAGAYWIGLISGGSPNVASVVFDSVPGSAAFNSNSFALGPSNPFGPSGADDHYLDLEADYTTASGPL